MMDIIALCSEMLNAWEWNRDFCRLLSVFMASAWHQFLQPNLVSSTPAEHAPVSTSIAPVCPPTITASPNELLSEPQIANQAHKPDAEQNPEQAMVTR